MLFYLHWCRTEWPPCVSRSTWCVDQRENGQGGIQNLMWCLSGPVAVISTTGNAEAPDTSVGLPFASSFLPAPLPPPHRLAIAPPCSVSRGVNDRLSTTTKFSDDRRGNGVCKSNILPQSTVRSRWTEDYTYCCEAAFSLEVCADIVWSKRCTLIRLGQYGASIRLGKAYNLKESARI
jgi:hypothetical protein